MAVRMTVSLRVAVRTFPAGMRMLYLHLERLEQNSQQTHDADDPGEVANTLFHHDLTIIRRQPKINRRSFHHAASSQKVQPGRILTDEKSVQFFSLGCGIRHHVREGTRNVFPLKNRGFITD